jgi:tRNA U34 5-carboxymethylaminomethyl modifying enzyme MnmG/GidA
MGDSFYFDVIVIGGGHAGRVRGACAPLARAATSARGRSLVTDGAGKMFV